MTHYETTQKIDQGFARRSIDLPTLAELPPSMEQQPVTMRQFASFATDFHELAAKFSAYDNSLDELIKRQIEHNRRLGALDAAASGLRDELEELNARVVRYAFALVTLIGLVVWVK